MENEPFLTTSKDEKRLYCDAQQPDSKSSDRAWTWKRALAIQLLLAIIYTAITFALLHKDIFFVQPTESSGKFW